MDYNDQLIQGGSKDLHFWYKARLGLIKQLLKSKLGSQNERLILNIGCGTGTETRILKKFGRIIALDINKNAIEEIKKHKIETILTDIESYDLGKNVYDAICCFDVLEHLEKDQHTLKTIFKALKPGGYIFFTIPAFQFLFGPHDRALEHKRRYSKKEITKKLSLVGFNDVSVNYWNSILFPLMLTFRILKKTFVKNNANNKPESGQPNKYLNTLLYNIMLLDNKLAKSRIKIPFGLSIFGTARKVD